MHGQVIFCMVFYYFILIIYSYNKTKETLVWQDVGLDDFPHMCTIINLLLSLPPTSVSCETSFSQMKLIKTSRRSRLQSSTLNSLMTVKLLSESIENFNPEEAVDKWLVNLLVLLIYWLNIKITYTLYLHLVRFLSELLILSLIRTIIFN